MVDHRDTDLFGNPVRARKGLRGRPPVELTAKDLDMLEAALMQGWSNQRTAKVLGVGVSTLKRKFGPLLKQRDQLPDRLSLVLFATAVRKAVEGQDMGAVRQVRQMIADNEARLADARMRTADDAPSEEKLGKKEAARRAAEEAAAGDGGAWGDLLSGGYTN